MPTDKTLRGISKFVRSVVAAPPIAPKIEINAIPIPPQHAPAPAPIIEAKIPDLNFLVLALRKRIL